MLLFEKTYRVLLTASNIGALALGRFPSPRSWSAEPGGRRGWRFLLFNYCNGLVGRVRPAMSAGSPVACPRTRPAHKRGRWFQPGLAVRAQNIGFLAQVLAGALFARPSPALPRSRSAFGGLGAEGWGVGGRGGWQLAARLLAAAAGCRLQAATCHVVLDAKRLRAAAAPRCALCKLCVVRCAQSAAASYYSSN
jgi:hypothetical protein